MTVDDSNIRVVLNDEDLPFEEDLLRNPSSMRPWLRYIEHRKNAPKSVINLIYERALKELPGSYKLWYNYLRLREDQMESRVITDPGYEEVNNAFERSLVFMHKMPVIWIHYSSFLVHQQKITRCRRVFDRALRALPITQHGRLWPLYIHFIRSHNVPETAVRVFRRYMKLCPEDAEEFIDYLTEVGRLDDAAVLLASLVNDKNFVSKFGKSNYALWNDLCKLISENPSEIKSLNVDAIIRSGLRRYSDQVGHLWCSLSDYYIRSGLFERARDIYEEAIARVTTVRDFSQVFDAYSQFEELHLSQMMEEIKKGRQGKMKENKKGEFKDVEKFDEKEEEEKKKKEELTLELAFARFDDLIERRPLLLNSVLLRQNPHNVSEWLKRVSLLEGKPKEVIATFTEAVSTVDPKQAVGKLHLLWIQFAQFYEGKKQIEDARIIFEKATHVPFVRVEDLASIWCEWSEMELRTGGREKECLELLQRAVAPPPKRISYHDAAETVQMRLHKSLKVWSLYADMEESFGTFSSTKSVYDRILELKIATPQIIINYGYFLKEHHYFEEAFKAYEKGISLFKWPNVFDIWNTYLTEFLERYGGTKLERARDLFEQCLESCPKAFAKPIYLLYAKLEEEHGMARHSMAVYDRAIEAVTNSERFSLFTIYLRKASEIYGVTRTRQIYEKAIEVLSDKESREMCIRFAELEMKLGEIDRARAIFGHCSQMSDPRVTPEFWEKWKDFEVKHGNEDTLREMLRIKRSIIHSFNTQVNMMSAQMITTTTSSSASKIQKANMSSCPPETMASLEAKVLSKTSSISFVKSESDSTQTVVLKENPDEIDIDDDDNDEDDDDNVIEKQVIPMEVFGGINTAESASLN